MDLAWLAGWLALAVRLAAWLAQDVLLHYPGLLAGLKRPSLLPYNNICSKIQASMLEESMIGKLRYMYTYIDLLDSFRLLCVTSICISSNLYS